MNIKDFNLKPFDRVLVRDFADEEWQPDFLGEVDEDEGVWVLGNVHWDQCIPYEGNEYLCNTTNAYEGPLKPKDGEFCVVDSVFSHPHFRLIYIHHGGVWPGPMGGAYVQQWVCDDPTESGSIILQPSILLDLHGDKEVACKRRATEEEKQMLLDSMHAAHRDWDEEKRKVVVYGIKNGDFYTAHRECGDLIFIFQHYDNEREDDVHFHALLSRSSDAYANTSEDGFCIDGYLLDACDIVPATDKEKKLLLNEINAAGCVWDEKAKKIRVIKPSKR